MNAYTSHELRQFAATRHQLGSVASHSESASMMALQVGKLSSKAAKRRQVHLLCMSLVQLLGGK